MKKMKRTIGSVIMLLGSAALMNGQSALPKVRIMGKTFYYYESQKGETLSEIADRNGWDLSMLARTNPEVSHRPDAGTLIYYPVPKAGESASSKKNVAGGHFSHNVKGGETVYGIARQYNTTPEEIFRLNPAVEQKGLKKGSVILIPMADAGVVENVAEEFEDFDESAPRDVKASDWTSAVSSAGSRTPINSSSKLSAGSSVELAENTSDNSVNTASRESQNDLSVREHNNYLANDKREEDFNRDMPSQNGKYIFHTVGEDESLYGIARAYETSIEDIFKVNPGLGAGGPAAGSIIRIPTERKAQEKYLEKVEESSVESLTQYKVKRGDSWGTIAETFNITEETLRSANPDIEKPEKGAIISIPVVTTIVVEKEVTAEDPREKNAQGVQELYDEVHSLSQADRDRYTINETPTVGVAVILTDVGRNADEVRNKQNKEMEFSRGAITAVDALKNNPYKTRLTILDGSLPVADITSALDEFNPSMIVSTSDTSLPQYILDYVADKQVLVVNAFDARDESYIDNPKVLQYLVPTSYMNAEITDYFDTNFKDYKLIIAGNPESSDALGASIIETFAKRGKDWVAEYNIAELPETVLEDDGKYLIYGTPTGSKDVKMLLENIGEMRMRNVMSDIRVMGRPNWVPYTSTLGDLMGENYVYLPSRFYFDPDDSST
ncbi:MAG: LysM peptidoglycan-binding domain-containing protein, partial [Muribaculaceae bacterium]|nr:LysM peptidoglycan-binding domain-containing protein [Muribaculaceae bacterium]